MKQKSNSLHKTMYRIQKNDGNSDSGAQSKGDWLFRGAYEFDVEYIPDKRTVPFSTSKNRRKFFVTSKS